jgi:hypothetical protein
MRRTAAPSAAFVAVLILANLGGASLAAAAGGNPDKPTPPGQAAKAEENPGKASAPGQEQIPPGQAAKAEEKPAPETPPGQSNEKASASVASDEEKGEEKVKVAHASAASDDAAAPAKQKQGHASGSRPTASVLSATSAPARSNSAVAHTHVIICHRTGSESNPYVVINISMSAWLHGHSTHPDLNGHSDILLKMGAAPGEKMPKSACGQSGGGDTPHGPPPPSGDPPTKIHDPRPGGGPAAPTGSPADPAGPMPANDPASPKPESGQSESGVAARLAETAVQGKLPFTGLPLWIVGLIGLALIAAGLALLAAANTEAALLEERADEVS